MFLILPKSLTSTGQTDGGGVGVRVGRGRAVGDGVTGQLTPGVQVGVGLTGQFTPGVQVGVGEAGGLVTILDHRLGRCRRLSVA